MGSVDLLPTEIRWDSQNPQLMTNDDIPSDVLLRLRTIGPGTTMKHIFTVVNHMHILESYGPNFWFKWAVMDDSSDAKKVVHNTTIENPYLQSASDNIIDPTNLSLEHLFRSWKEDRPPSKNAILNLKMNPPDHMSSINKTKKTPQVKPLISPNLYLTSKYYESLFSVNVPLAYFIKSNLSRLRNMCGINAGAKSKEGNLNYQAIISQTIFEVEDFDRRHDGIKFLQNDLNDIAANEMRTNCLRKYNINLGSPIGHNFTEASALSTIIKARELKLQVILLLEVIHQNTLDSKFENFDEIYSKKMKARAYNVTKRFIFRRKLSDAKFSSNRHSGETTIDFCEMLDLFLDKMCILDVLLASEPAVISDEQATSSGTLAEIKANLVDSGKEDSLYGFVTFLLVPYFGKKVPNAIRHIVKKFKGPSFRPRKMNKAKSISKEEVGDNSNSSHIKEISEFVDLGCELTRPTLSPNISSLQYPKSFASYQTKPDLVSTRANSNLSDVLESESKSGRSHSLLPRTKSDLVMQHLQKRQLSVSEFTTHKEDLDSYNHLSQNTKKGQSPYRQVSFRRVGKRHSSSNKLDHSKAITYDESKAIIQVSATPAGKVHTSKRANVIESAEKVISPIGYQSNEECNRSPISITGELEPNLTGVKTTQRKVRRRLFAPYD